MHCCTPISNLLMLTTPYAYAYNPVMLAEMPRSHHSSSSSSEDSLLHCTDNEFNTSPEKSPPIKKLAPTPISPVSLPAVHPQSSPLVQRMSGCRMPQRAPLWVILWSPPGCLSNPSSLTRLKPTLQATLLLQSKA